MLFMIESENITHEYALSSVLKFLMEDKSILHEIIIACCPVAFHE